MTDCPLSAWRMARRVYAASLTRHSIETADGPELCEMVARCLGWEVSSETRLTGTPPASNAPERLPLPTAIADDLRGLLDTCQFRRWNVSIAWQDVQFAWQSPVEVTLFVRAHATNRVGTLSRRERALGKTFADALCRAFCLACRSLAQWEAQQAEERTI